MIRKVIEKLPEKLKSQIEFINCSPGEIIIEQDGIFKNVYWVTSGLLKAFHTTEKGQEFLVAIFGKDETFGELEYFNKNKNIASIECITECRLITIPENVFEIILHKDKFLNEHITKKIAERLYKISLRSIESNYYSLEYLISRYLLIESERTGNKMFEINKTDVAHYFATNLRSVNRLLKKFTDNKMIVSEGNLIEIIDKLKLREFTNEAKI